MATPMHPRLYLRNHSRHGVSRPSRPVSERSSGQSALQLYQRLYQHLVTRWMGPIGSMGETLYKTLDHFAGDILNAEKASHFEKTREAVQQAPTRLLQPEADIKHLMTTAASLEDVWLFFLKRLCSGSGLDFVCLSILDEREDTLRVRFLYPGTQQTDVPSPFSDPLISLLDDRNHLVRAFVRKDTTYCSQLSALGETLTAQMPAAWLENNRHHLFSIPFIAGNKAVALMTLGFQEVDAFSQAKLSYMYTVRDQLAQLMWSLILKERMSRKPMVDAATGLVTVEAMQTLLLQEVERAALQETPLSLLMLSLHPDAEGIDPTDSPHTVEVLLKQVASRIRRLVRGIDTVIETDTDTLAVILPEIGTDRVASLCERLMQSFAPGFTHGSETDAAMASATAAVSLGYACYPQDDATGETLYDLARQALKLARFKSEKTGESSMISAGALETLNEKTVLEVFASKVAQKYTPTSESVFYSLVQPTERTKSPIVTGHTAEQLMIETIRSLAGALDAKDRYTRGHSQAVANYAVALAHALGLTAHEVEQIRLAALLHDIGKIGIPESVLCKEGPLNDEEWEIMKQHPVIGARQILAPVSAFSEVIPMVEFHHESWDGTGYPNGIAGDEIPLGARIVSIVDAFHGLTSDRAYRKAMAVADARNILNEGSGTKWDPNLMGVFLNILTIASPSPQRAAEHRPEEALSA